MKNIPRLVLSHKKIVQIVIMSWPSVSKLFMGDFILNMILVHQNNRPVAMLCHMRIVAITMLHAYDTGLESCQKLLEEKTNSSSNNSQKLSLKR